MNRISFIIPRNLDKVVGTECSLSEDVIGTVVSYDRRTGAATIEIKDEMFENIRSFVSGNGERPLYMVSSRKPTNIEEEEEFEDDFEEDDDDNDFSFTDDSDVYYRLYRTDRDKITVVEMQDFDEADYDERRFIKDRREIPHKFSTEQAAIKKMFEWYSKDEIDEEFVNLDDNVRE